MEEVGEEGKEKILNENFDSKNFDFEGFDSKDFDFEGFDSKDFEENFDSKDFDFENFDSKPNWLVLEETVRMTI